MTPERLAELRAMAEKAAGIDPRNAMEFYGGHALDALPELLDEIERLRAELAQAKECVCPFLVKHGRLCEDPAERTEIDQ